MKCPVDQQTLRRDQVDEGLAGFECSHCRGHWLRFGDYLAWREGLGREWPEISADHAGQSVPQPSAEPAAPGSLPRRCPDCDYLLSRLTVGHGVGFALDRCGNCNGIWLDEGEWESLRARGLHDNVHQMFSSAWQRAVRTEAQRKQTEAQFERQLGRADFDRTREFGGWLAGNPRAAQMLAYLQWIVRGAPER